MSKVKTCPICGKEFKTNSGVQKYCSYTCQAFASRQYIVTCHECGKQLAIGYGGYLKRTKSCSICGGTHRTIKRATQSELITLYRKEHGISKVKEPTPIQKEFQEVYNNMHGETLIHNATDVDEETATKYLQAVKENVPTQTNSTTELETTVQTLVNKVMELENKQANNDLSNISTKLDTIINLLSNQSNNPLQNLIKGLTNKNQ